MARPIVRYNLFMFKFIYILILLFMMPAMADNLIKGKVSIAEGQDVDMTTLVVSWRDGDKFPNVKNPIQTHLMAQQNKKFSPRMRAVRVGDKIDFRNDDDLFHNVFSLDPGQQFDLGIFKKNQRFDEAMKMPLNGKFESTITIKKAGRLNIFCHLHEDMSALVYSFDHAYFVQVSNDGSFSIAAPPKGKHILVVQGVMLSKPWQKEVSIPHEKDLTIEISVDQTLKAPMHTDKLGRPYKKKEWSLDDKDVY